MNKDNIILIVCGLALLAILGLTSYGITHQSQQPVIIERDSQPNTGYTNQADTFVITKKITNSNIATSTNATTGLDLTNPVTGSLFVDDIIITTDTTGLATSTPWNQQCTGVNIMASGNSASSTVMAVTSVGTLEANETLNFTNASSSQKIRIDNGSKLMILPLTKPCQGSGVTTFTIIFKKTDARSSIYE